MKSNPRLVKHHQYSEQNGADDPIVILQHLTIHAPVEVLSGEDGDHYLNKLYKEAELLAYLTNRSTGKDRQVIQSLFDLRLVQYERLYPHYEEKRAAAMTAWLEMRKKRPAKAVHWYLGNSN